jgi:hypothetical protein
MLFPGGKVYFDYRLHDKYGTHPYAIHATYQRYNNPGKRSRFREAGTDPPAYPAAPLACPAATIMQHDCLCSSTS